MTGSLPDWLQRFLGVDAAASGEGTVWRLSHAWSWAPWVTLLLAVFAVVFVAFVYSRESGSAGRLTRIVLAGLRLACITIVLLMIAEFVLLLARTGLPYIVVLVDDSASMGIADRYDSQSLSDLIERRLAVIESDEPTRLNLAKAVLLEDNASLLQGIRRRHQLKVYYLTGDAGPAAQDHEGLTTSIRSLEATGENSRLGDRVRAVLNDFRGTPPSALVLLTDGINTEGETLNQVAQYAQRKMVPLYTVALGSEEPSSDIELTDLMVDEVVFVDDIVQFQFTLSATGLEGREVDVVLRDKQRDAELARLKLTLGPDGQPRQVRLPYRPTEVGEFQYVVQVAALPEEVADTNNSGESLVSVRKEQIRVLMVSSQPTYEFRRLKEMLERDSTIQLRTVLQDADLDYAETDRTALRVFPVRRDELFEYDVILFGDVDPAFLSASVMVNIADFVKEKGGGLVFVAGPLYMPTAYRSTPLAALMPIAVDAADLSGTTPAVDGQFVARPTALGLASPTLQLGDTLAESADIWSRLPALYWYIQTPRLKPAARVLLEHPTQLGADGRPLPLVCMQYVGAGKVLFHATDETWRWRFRVGDVLFARYWVQTIRYLSRSKLLAGDRTAELTTDRREYTRGEAVRIRVRFSDERQAPVADDGVTVILQRKGLKNHRLQLHRHAANRGIFEGTFAGAAQGSYHAWVATPSPKGRAPAADFLVVAPPGEFERTQTDAEELKKVSLETKGRHYTIETAHRLLKDLPAGRQVPVERLPPVVLWNKWPVLLLFLTLLVTEWIVRKRMGLL